MVDQSAQYRGTVPEIAPEQTDALVHWSSFGRPGQPVTSRFVPDGDERNRFTGFVQPRSARWNDEFDDAQTQSLLRGFPRGQMEDKWIVRWVLGMGDRQSGVEV